MTLLSKRSIAAVETEAAAGTAETLLAADAALNVFNYDMQPQITFEPRDGQGALSQRPQVGGARMGTATFETELVGGATIPLWAELLPACGWAPTSRVYAPVLQPPGTGGVTTVTLGKYEHGKLKRLSGCMGDFRIEFAAGKVPRIFWSFMGKYFVTPTDTSELTPTYPSDEANLVRFSDTNMTIGSWAPSLSRLVISAGNQVTMVEDQDHADGTGYKHALVTNRRVNGTMDPEAELVADNALESLWLALTEQALDFDLAVGTNNGFVFAAAALQFVNVQGANRNGILTDNVEFQLNPSAGGDEFTIEFDTV
jgi:hypothetical protein